MELILKIGAEDIFKTARYVMQLEDLKQHANVMVTVSIGMMFIMMKPIWNIAVTAVLGMAVEVEAAVTARGSGRLS